VNLNPKKQKNLSIGVLGGSFDPIHQGHINIAKEVFEKLNLDKVFFLPCKIHPYKKSIKASNNDRLAMLELGIKDFSFFHIDKREIERPGASFTFDSLKAIRDEYGKEVKISLIMGSDVFSLMHNWHRYQEILSLTNIVVINRYGAGELGEVKNDYLSFLLEERADEINLTHGQIKILDISKYDISSTQLRSEIKNKSFQFSSKYISSEVLDYILKKKLYS
tara:strand:+ start:124 stop:786 length:663 start_codon:yes stop_codon:yes gene_type:complete